MMDIVCKTFFFILEDGGWNFLFVYIDLIVDKSLFEGRFGSMDLVQIKNTKKKSNNTYNTHNSNSCLGRFWSGLIDALSIVLGLAVVIFTRKVLFKVIVIGSVSQTFLIILLGCIIVIVVEVAAIFVVIVVIVLSVVVVIIVVVVGIVIVVVVVSVVVIVVVGVGLFAVIFTILDHTNIVANGTILKLIPITNTNFLVEARCFALSVAKATAFGNTGIALILMEDGIHSVGCTADEHHQ